jgi:hypothetical protein
MVPHNLSCLDVDPNLVPKASMLSPLVRSKVPVEVDVKRPGLLDQEVGSIDGDKADVWVAGVCPGPPIFPFDLKSKATMKKCCQSS